MIKIHSDFHTLLAELGLPSHDYYTPSQWIPHCTMAQDLEERDMDVAVETSRQVLTAINGRIERIGLVEFRRVTRLCAFLLAPSVGISG